MEQRRRVRPARRSGLSARRIDRRGLDADCAGARGPAAYTAHHGQGYTTFTYSGRGLDHELLLFVPLVDPIKLICLKVRNVGRQPRRLSATFFAEWVLGTVRDQSSMRVVTELDADNGALLARNRFNADFSTAVAFADVNARPRIWTCDRTEFLGRNGSLACAGRAVGARSGDCAKTVERQRRRCALSLRRARGILRPSTR